MLATLAIFTLGLGAGCTSDLVKNNLDKHKEGFATRNLTLLASTYSPNAVFRVTNQYNLEHKVVSGRDGLKEVFTYLWDNLGSIEEFNKYFSAPQVLYEENCALCDTDQDASTGPGCVSGNIFIVWEAPELGFKSGSDTLLIDSSGLTRLHNAVFWFEPKDEPKNPEGTVLCPGQPAGNYCDCQGDCTGEPSFCSCSAAKKCCQGATPTVTCPGQPAENYCDCQGDCTNNPSWCSCGAAKKCCAGSNSLAAPAWQSFLSSL